MQRGAAGSGGRWSGYDQGGHGSAVAEQDGVEDKAVGHGNLGSDAGELGGAGDVTSGQGVANVGGSGLEGLGSVEVLGQRQAETAEGGPVLNPRFSGGKRDCGAEISRPASVTKQQSLQVPM